MNEITMSTLKNVERKRNLDTQCIVEKSKDNENIIKIIKNSREVYLGSKYNVKREINNFINSLTLDKNNIYIIYGLAAGEYIERLLSKFGTEEVKIIVIEPDEAVIKAFLKLSTRKILEDDRIFLIKYTRNELYFLLVKIIDEAKVKKIQYSIFANYASVFSKEYDACTSEIQQFVNEAISNVNTKLKFSKSWFQCYVKNLRYIPYSTPVDFFSNACLNLPAVIVSAGPSLEKNIRELKKYQKNCIIICCGRTLKPLLDLEIIPDFLCVVDPDDIAYRQVEKLNYSVVNLVYFEHTNWKVVENHKGNKIINSSDENLYNITKNNIGALDHGGSVAHNALGMAIKLGCNPIMFIGQDFAYTDNKLHAEIALGEEQNKKTTENEEYIRVKGICENTVITTPILNFYKETMEKMLSYYAGREYINCTEGGADIIGTNVINFKTALEIHCKKSITSSFHNFFNKDNNMNEKNIEKFLLETLDTLKQVKKLCFEVETYDEKVDFKISRYLEENFLLNYIYYPIKFENFNQKKEQILSELGSAEISIKETIDSLRSVDNGRNR